MLTTNKTFKLNSIYLILLITIFYSSYTKIANCNLSISKIKNKSIKNNSKFKKLDINLKNNKDNIFKIDLTANPSNKSNSFLDITSNKELYFASYKMSHGVKQFLHFHSSVKKII